VFRQQEVLVEGFQIAELRVDPKAGEIAGPGGLERLDPKVMGVLVMMAQHAGEVVSREALLAQLWPNAVVSDDALTRCFYELRRCLARAGGESFRSIIETLPKRGYRLNARIDAAPRPAPTPAPASPAPPPRAPERASTAIGTAPRKGSAWQRIALLALLAATILFVALRVQRADPPPAKTRTAAAATTPEAAARRSIAVLPFVDMSAGGSAAFLADGISEEIINRLAKSAVLRVIARTSSFSFRGQAVDIRTIASRLDVSHVLEGSVRTEGNRVRVTAQLIAAANSSHVWSRTYERNVGDLFTLQDEIATSVAAALDATIAAGAARGEAPVNAEAYQVFLRGRFFYNRRAPGDVERAVAQFERAVGLDPGFARGWAALAGAYALLAGRSGPESARLRARQGAAARRAVEAGPALAVAHARLAQFLYADKHPAEADAAFRTAFSLDSHDPLVLGYMAAYDLERGDYEAALVAQREVVSRDPLSGVEVLNLATYSFLAGRLPEAAAGYRTAIALSGDIPEWELALVQVLARQRKFDEALQQLPHIASPAIRDLGLALLQEAPGQRSAADGALARLIARPGSASDIQMAEVFAFRGQVDAAFATLANWREALSRSGGLGPSGRINAVETLRTSPLLQPLHADPRWTALLAAK